MGHEPSKSRRSFLAVLTAVGSAAIGAVLAIPGASYVIDPLLRGGGKKGRWIKVADAEGLSSEHPSAFPVEGEQTDAWTRSEQVRLGVVWLRKKGDEIVALSAECPHLGCKVGYDKSAKKFACPCHDSAFTATGERLGGPAPRSLDPLETRVVDGEVEVRFVRFRAQVAEREEIG
jgi:Rieske Fe-S protein